MRRLKRVAEKVVIDELYARIKNSSNNIKDNCYVLLENLNELYKDYPDIYNEMKLVVKLPNDDFGNYIVNLVSDIEDFEKYIQDLEVGPEEVE